MKQKLQVFVECKDEQVWSVLTMTFRVVIMIMVEMVEMTTGKTVINLG